MNKISKFHKNIKETQFKIEQKHFDGFKAFKESYDDVIYKNAS